MLSIVAKLHLWNPWSRDDDPSTTDDDPSTSDDEEMSSPYPLPSRPEKPFNEEMLMTNNITLNKKEL